jgi:choline dehydrogenase-like flavoprotein
MLHDLSQSTERQASAHADVVVVGAGLAGLVLAARLSRSGMRVLVLESGGESQSLDVHPLNEVVQIGQTYAGASVGRFRCLGGTSTRWGGAMLPFLPCDVGPHTAGWNGGWPLTLDAVSGTFAELERLFQLPLGTYEPELPGTADGCDSAFFTRSAKWPPFRMRNAAHVFRREIASAGIQIWLNATVTRFQMDDAGRLATVTATSPAGTEICIASPVFVLAAGAIESTRLLLLLDAQHGEQIFKPGNVLGRYFYDHLAAPAGTITPIDRTALNAAFAMRFAGGGMRDRRLEPAVELRARNGLPGAFVNVLALSDNTDGFAALRSIYRDIQRRTPVQLQDLGHVLSDFEWFARAVWWRFAKGRLLAPTGARFEAYLNIEQKPDANNQIILAPEARDVFGNPLAQIDWRVRDADIANFHSLQHELVAYWAGSRNAQLGVLHPVPQDVWKAVLCGASDIFHPGGSTRMGTGSSDGVVDVNLKTFQVDNLYVVSTSVFPSGGSANPSFMLMAFALRAADHIAATWRVSPATSRTTDQVATAQSATAVAY